MESEAHRSRGVLFTSGWPVLLLAGCVVDLTPSLLLAPGDGGTDVEIDMSGCGVTCPEGWTKACVGATSWCTSPYQGRANCCNAWSACTAQGGYPGFWPNVQGYDGLFPQGFDSYVPTLPAVVVGWSGYLGAYPTVNFACIGSGGVRTRGWTETVEYIGTCSGETCAAWANYPDDLCKGTTDIECCAHLAVGCGCEMPFWCVIYFP
jgi:hypothetical protein